jgi:ATP-dependent RNA helicase DDX1
MAVPKNNSLIQGGGSHNHNNSYSCVCLHGDRKPPERKANLERFKKQEAKFLICTDVAARGLDITGLPFSKYRECPYNSSSFE